MTSSIVGTPKRHFPARKHVVLAIKRENGSTGSTWAQDREKKGKDDSTGQSKKSQRRYISPIWWEAPTEPIFTKSCTVVDVLDLITCASFWAEIFRGYDFTGSRIFRFPIDSFMGLTTVQRYCAACDCGTNRYRWTQRPEMLQRGSYWWTVVGGEKLGHHDLLYGVLGHRRNAYIFIISANNWPVVTKFARWVHLTGMQQLSVIWPTFWGHRGQNVQKRFGTTRVAQIVTAVHRDL